MAHGPQQPGKCRGCEVAVAISSSHDADGTAQGAVLLDAGLSLLQERSGVLERQLYWQNRLDGAEGMGGSKDSNAADIR